MPEIFRSRDVVVFWKAVTFTVEVPESAAVSGWRGGQGFNWLQPPQDGLLATISDGVFGGFALWGSDESSDEFTAMTRNMPTYRFAVIGAGGWIISTSTYERYTYASRMAGPLVPIVYNASDKLRFSLRGYFTSEDEWTLSGDPRAPNLNYVGSVAQRPVPSRNNYLTVQVII
jgi:hypothetical protein